MRWFAAFVLGLALGLSASAGAEEAPTSGAADVEVRALVDRYVAARESQDPRAIEALFSEDADQLTTSGEWRRGRGAVVLGSLASSRRNAGTRHIAIDAVRLVAADVAIADGSYEIRGVNGAIRRMRTTFVAVRGAAGWRIAAIRNMAPTEP
jgi:uncharacterized protein (TIGR02246 family)